ncbi:MAG: hypothetical protein H5U30_02055 [Marinobacter sp.]|nr:hypothetical protein [Marinobacter sp.]
MREQPVGDELLSCARDFLKTDILPELQGDKKHGLLMVMNAMAIATRQLRNGENAEQQELEDIRALVNAPECELVEANRLLAVRLRDGAGDPGKPDRDALLKHLWTVTKQRLAESNPKALGE